MAKGSTAEKRNTVYRQQPTVVFHHRQNEGSPFRLPAINKLLINYFLQSTGKLIQFLYLRCTLTK